MQIYYLVNAQSRYFDHYPFECDVDAVEWAQGRGGDYILQTCDDELIARWKDGVQIETHL